MVNVHVLELLSEVKRFIVFCGITTIERFISFTFWGGREGGREGEKGRRERRGWEGRKGKQRGEGREGKQFKCKMGTREREKKESKEESEEVPSSVGKSWTLSSSILTLTLL